MKITSSFLAATAVALFLSTPVFAAPKKGGKASVAPPAVSVSIVSPAANATVHGTVPVEVAVPDNVAVKSVVLFLDGYFVDAKSYAPWTLVFASAHLLPGAHTLQAQVKDGSGNWTNSPVITVNVVPPSPDDDIQPPSQAAIVNPCNYDAVSGIVPIMVESADNVGVVCIAVYVDGKAPVMCAGSKAVVEWNTAGLAPGSYHYIQAVAYDAAGNYRTAPMITAKIAG